jgi:PKD repeat protein
MKNKCMAALLITGLGLAGCSKSTVDTGSKLDGGLSMSSQSAFQNKILEVSDLTISVPQIIEVESTNTYSVSLPISNNPGTLDALESIEWNFGDGSAVVSSLVPVNYIYYTAGRYTITIKATSLAGDVVTYTTPINVLPFQERACDLSQILISGPQVVVAGSSQDYTVNIPSCFASQVVGVSWNFADGSAPSTNQNVSHVFDSAGSYVVTVELQGPAGQAPITLQHLVFVSPAPTTTTTLPPTTTTIEVPTTTTLPPTTTTLDTNPLLCSPENGPRVTDGDIFSEDVACGMNGHKTKSFRMVKTEECKLNGENKYRWEVISDVKTLVSEGPCLGQTCQFGSQTLNDGQSIRVYNTPTPVGSCESLDRVCQNGVLSGPSSAIYLTCAEGCAGFGPSGTVKSEVVIGEVQVPLACAYGEEGFFDLFNQVATQTCISGSVQNSNIHQGSIKSAGSCPTYSFVPTEQYTACSADCGGNQQQIFVCKDNKGVIVDNGRCGGVFPIVSRACDGNPEAVKRSESSVRTEEASSCKLCPTNQIGIVLKTRDITTVKSFACVDHSVQQVNESEQVGNWIEERYCKDYVAKRCSQDSLDNGQAHGRLEWMKKCQDDIPAVKEFLANFDNVNQKVGSSKVAIDSRNRILYPTFMIAGDGKKDKVWIAPKDKSAACSVAPKNAYVAAVCVSSCATPEQEILSQMDGRMKNRTFIEALTGNAPVVATLNESSSMRSKQTSRTAVEQWVTELIDTEHEILVFRMASGGELRVTPNHPMLDSSGTIRLADNMHVGEHLVKLGGVLDEIVSIEQTKYFGKVYNLFVHSSDPKRNIVITNGYLNGTAFFQNEGAEIVNRRIFKRSLIRGVW